jgi:hypothetical protein
VIAELLADAEGRAALGRRAAGFAAGAGWASAAEIVADVYRVALAPGEVADAPNAELVGQD